MLGLCSPALSRGHRGGNAGHELALNQTCLARASARRGEQRGRGELCQPAQPRCQELPPGAEALGWVE